MSFSSEMIEYNPQCEASDKPGSLSVIPLLYVAALFLLHIKPKQRNTVTVEVVEEVELEPSENISAPPPAKTVTQKLEAIRVPSIPKGDLRQSIIYALAEFGPQTAKEILATIGNDFPDLPLKGKQGVGLNSHLYSMKNNKILGTFDATPPVWFVIEA
jgi:hypothetical protein